MRVSANNRFHWSHFFFSNTLSHLIEHYIDVRDAQHIKQRFYCVFPDKREQLEKAIQHMLDNRTENSKSIWISLSLLVKKKIHI